MAGACAFAATRLPAYSAGPPVAHTGGFGEPTCRECHFDYEINEPGATVRLDSLPDTIQPGATYALRLVVRHPELKRGGFELTARTTDGEQAGTFTLPDTTRLQQRTAKGITYLMHRVAGTRRMDGDSVAWQFHWTAPATAAAVQFDVAVNVANDDDSEFGDRIYTRSFRAGVRDQ